jgi:hypothetical protein
MVMWRDDMDCGYILAARESDRKERKSNRCCHLSVIMIDFVLQSHADFEMSSYSVHGRTLASGLVWCGVASAVCEDRREFVLLPTKQASKSYASYYYEHVSIICAYRKRQRSQR